MIYLHHALIPPEILDLPGQFGRSSQVKGEGRGQPLPFNLGALTASFFATTWQGTPLTLVYVGNRTPREGLHPPGQCDLPGKFPIFREDSISICKVPICDRYSNILEGADNGKLYVIKPVFSIDCGGLGTTFLSHLFFHVKRFWIWPSFSG